MAQKRLTNEQVFQMISIIATKYGATLYSINHKDGVIDVDCPEDNKPAFAIEAAETMQNILE